MVELDTILAGITATDPADTWIVVEAIEDPVNPILMRRGVVIKHCQNVRPAYFDTEIASINQTLVGRRI